MCQSYLSEGVLRRAQDENKLGMECGRVEALQKACHAVIFNPVLIFKQKHRDAHFQVFCEYRELHV
jgi:hypothetical protein